MRGLGQPIPPRPAKVLTGRSGLTLLEMTIGLSVLAVLGLTIATSTATMRDMAFSSSVQDQLQLQARRAMQAIATDVRLSANVNLDTGGANLDYPLVFTDAGPDAAYDADDHDFETAPKSAEPNESDFGGDEGLLLCIPADADGDGSPDFDLATGELVWDTGARISYSRRQGIDGRSHLVRTVDGGASRIVARDVELVQFDVNSLASPDVPLNSVRARVAFRATGQDGHEYRYRTEFVVLMRSSD